MREQTEGPITMRHRPYWLAAVQDARAALVEADAHLGATEQGQPVADPVSLELALTSLHAAVTAARFALADARDRWRLPADDGE